MARLKSSSARLALGIAASACTGSGYGLSPHHNPTMTSVNQPVVQRTDYVFDVAAAGGVPASEQERLAAWFDTIDVGYGDRVSIDSGGAYADAASRADVADRAASRGLLLSEGAPVTAGNVQPGSIRVSPLPKAIEHADPGGVICTNRTSSLTVWSWSAWKPTFS